MDEPETICVTAELREPTTDLGSGLGFTDYRR